MSARFQRAPLSSDVAEVANRPKKRPGKRERSSITTRRRALLVESRTIPNFYHRAHCRDNRSFVRSCPLRHGRACPGHPSILREGLFSMDAWVKPAHDERGASPAHIVLRNKKARGEPALFIKPSVTRLTR